ncbi:hypothetical protein FACS1894184_08620 [Clostridia bacterium]|nr:hypothetical protein FACS1894184_08620 [Clostridia bacterium]
MNLKTLANEESLKGFYPTPPRLVDRMLSKVDFLYVQSALEPSAGKGDIADALSKRMAYAMNRPYSDKKPPDLDAIEIDQNLRYILQGKGLRVVASDFLTFRTQKHYDLIIMNPPFEHGVTHLLKALELQEKGGAIICLLNAETLRNQHTYNRQLLSRKLTAYNAEIEYIQDAFTLAERKTNVEIALVRVTVPQAERESIIIERLRSSQRPKDVSSEDEQTKLAVGDFVQGIVDTCDFEISAGLKLISEWNALAPLILRKVNPNAPGANDPILRVTMSRERDYSSSTLNPNDYIKAVRYKYWEALFQNPKFMETMTSNLRSDLQAQVERLADYDFTPFNILTLCQELNGKVLKGIEDTILKLFDQLTHDWHWNECSSNRHYFDGWATNQCWRVSKRVVAQPPRNFTE